VGFSRKPPVTLQPGDTVHLEVTGLGVLENPIKDAEPRQGPRELPRLCAPR
jgi:2-keto-4-pentenoate hydratase/2-oxohepta-3-ene-1,7-dioic acid hydratase in catechol pathway